MEEDSIKAITVTPIGIIRSCFPEKFGIPRQAGMVREARARILLFHDYGRVEMIKGLDQFSHIWVHFLFHQTVAEGWKPTVRPPGLGGQERVGVFASRSPHRPNHLGFSAVELIGLHTSGKGVELEVGGGDFLDGTPVIDIKPYLPYSDACECALPGYSGQSGGDYKIAFTQQALHFCMEYEESTGRRLKNLISQVLRQDPRPASQRRRKSGFGVLLWDVNVRWNAQGAVFTVEKCNRV